MKRASEELRVEQVCDVPEFSFFLLEFADATFLLDCPAGIEHLQYYLPPQINCTAFIPNNNQFITNNQQHNNQYKKNNFICRVGQNNSRFLVPPLKVLKPNLSAEQIQKIDVVLVCSPWNLLGLPFIFEQLKQNVNIFATDACVEICELIVREINQVHNSVLDVIGGGQQQQSQQPETQKYNQYKFELNSFQKPNLVDQKQGNQQSQGRKKQSQQCNFAPISQQINLLDQQKQQINKNQKFNFDNLNQDKQQPQQEQYLVNLASSSSQLKQQNQFQTYNLNLNQYLQQQQQFNFVPESQQQNLQNFQSQQFNQFQRSSFDGYNIDEQLFNFGNSPDCNFWQNVQQQQNKQRNEQQRKQVNQIQNSSFSGLNSDNSDNQVFNFVNCAHSEDQTNIQQQQHHKKQKQQQFLFNSVDKNINQNQFQNSYLNIFDKNIFQFNQEKNYFGKKPDLNTAQLQKKKLSWFQLDCANQTSAINNHQNINFMNQNVQLGSEKQDNKFFPLHVQGLIEFNGSDLELVKLDAIGPNFEDTVELDLDFDDSNEKARHNLNCGDFDDKLKQSMDSEIDVDYLLELLNQNGYSVQCREINEDEFFKVLLFDEGCILIGKKTVLVRSDSQKARKVLVGLVKSSVM